MAVAELGHDVGVLAAALRADADANPRGLAQAAARLRETRPKMDTAASEQLARVLRLPLSLVEAWLDDTLTKLEANDDAARADALQRLEAMAWAWGEVPTSWPTDLELRARSAWSAP